jgi:hypothetical protein
MEAEKHGVRPSIKKKIKESKLTLEDVDKMIADIKESALYWRHH